jgi:hypothetical protein
MQLPDVVVVVVGGGAVVVGGGALVVGGGTVLVGTGGGVVVGLCAGRAGVVVALPDPPAEAGATAVVVVVVVVVAWLADERLAPDRCPDEHAAASRPTPSTAAADCIFPTIDMESTVLPPTKKSVPVPPRYVLGTRSDRSCARFCGCRHRRP